VSFLITNEVLVKAVDKRVKIEYELDAVKSKSKKERGLFEDKIRKKLNSTIEDKGKARKELDEAIYPQPKCFRTETDRIGSIQVAG